MSLISDAKAAYASAKESVVNYPNTLQNKANLYTARGTASPFDDGKYDIKNHSYPSDLMAADGRYGGNYAMFYINVAIDSKLAKNEANLVSVKDTPARDRGDLIGQNMSKAGLIGSNAAVVGVEAYAAKKLGIGSTDFNAKVAATATVGVGVAATMAPDAKRGQRRLKTAIALHIPNQLSIRYGVQWSEDDTTMLAMANAAGTEIAKAVTGQGKLKEAGGVAQAVITNIALSKGPNAAANSAALGLAANPKKEQVFKGVDFRTFSFDYQFFPRNPQEAKNVMNIIQEFKYHMHPEFKDTNNFVYIYPSEFDILYYANGKENKNLHRHTSCVLTEVNVNYTPNGVFSTFADGQPTQINLTLSFRELALLTKDKIKDGL
jgi:Tail-tube assembly protein